MKLTPTAAWQSVAITLNEIWQAHEGAVALDTDAVEANRLGIILQPGQSVAFEAGVTVYYRSINNMPNPLIARVAVSA